MAADREAELDARFASDPDVLAWARRQVERLSAQYRTFEACCREKNDLKAADQSGKFADWLEADLIGGRGCVITPFDERRPSLPRPAKADITPAALPLSDALMEIGARADAATPGPWDTEENEDCWQLFGALHNGLHPMQLVKAPKHGTPYAEYWPTPADGEFIAKARTDVPRLLAAFRYMIRMHATEGDQAALVAILNGKDKPGD